MSKKAMVRKRIAWARDHLDKIDGETDITYALEETLPALELLIGPGAPEAPKPVRCDHALAGTLTVRCQLPTGHDGAHFDATSSSQRFVWMADGILLVSERDAKPDKLEQAIAKLEAVVATTRGSIGEAMRLESWGEVSAYHNQAVAEDNALRILRGLR